MRELIISNVMKGITSNYNYDDVKLAEIKYGLEALYMTITKFAVIIIICLILGLFKELILFTILYSIIKYTGYGLHTKKSWQCWITSIPIFVCIPYLIKNYVIPNEIIYIILPLTIIAFILWAPADTEKRPLINKKKRIVLKVSTVIIGLVYSLIIIFVNNDYLNSLLFYSLLLESLLINPVSYKLFGLKYRNYLNYKRKGV